MFKVTFCFLVGDDVTEETREFPTQDAALAAFRELVRDGAQYVSLDYKRD